MKSKFYTLKYRTGHFLLASDGQTVLEIEIRSTCEHYRLGKKRGWRTDRGRDSLKTYMQEGKEEQGRETQAVSRNPFFPHARLWYLTRKLLRYYRLPLKDFQKTTAWTKESNLFKCKRPSC